MARRNNFIDSFINGLGRKSGFAASTRIINHLDKKIVNQKSKLRKKIDKFEFTGQFNTSIKRMYQLIETFYDEYKITDIPILQKGFYFYSDVNFIEYKLKFLKEFIENDNDNNKYEIICNLWSKIKSEF